MVRGATGRLSYGKVSNETLNPHIAGVKIATSIIRKVRARLYSRDIVCNAQICAATDTMSESHRGIAGISAEGITL